MIIDLAAIRARVEAATPGPWASTVAYPHLALQPDDDSIISFNLAANPASDALFVAHARADVPALLAEVERLRGELSAIADRALTLKGRLVSTGAEVERLRAQVAAAYRFADELGNVCSWHGVATRYAQELRVALDNAKEA